MRKSGLCCLLFLVMSAAAAEDHLIPVDTRMNSLHQNSGEYWFSAMNKGDITFLEFDTFPALDPMPSYLAVIGPNLQGPFRLCYQKDSYDKAGPQCAPIPVAFATALDSRAEAILRQITYGDNKMVGPPDVTKYYFKANFVYAESLYMDPGSAPDKLVNTLEKCVLLVTMPATDPHRQALMDEILKELDAIKLPDRS